MRKISHTSKYLQTIKADRFHTDGMEEELEKEANKDQVLYGRGKLSPIKNRQCTNEAYS